MNFTGEEKIKKLEAEMIGTRSPKQKCSLLIDAAMELRHTDPAAALREAQKALGISEEINFSLGKARSYFCMGLIYFNRADYENAFVFLDHAYQVYNVTGDKWGMSNALNNIGLIHLRLGNYVKALEYFSSSLQIKRESHDSYGTANVMISMAAIHRKTGNPPDAEMLLKQSLKISEEKKFDDLTGKGLMELGIILMMENKFSEATGKFEKAKQFFEKQNNSSCIAECFLHLGKVKSQLQDSWSAVSFFEEGKKIAEKKGDQSLVALFLCNIAAEKLRCNEPDEAMELLVKARKIAMKTQEKPMLSEIAYQFSTGYEAAGNLRDALLEYKNFIALKEEVSSAETITLLRNREISARVNSLSTENKLLEAEKMAAVGQLRALLNTQEIKSLNAMMEGQEKERKRIAADLHDRIGSSLSAIKLHLIGFAKLQKVISESQNEFEKVNSMFDQVVQEVRRVSHDLDSGVLMKFGVVSALKDLCESIESAGNLKVNFYSAGCDERLDHHREISLYRIAQELISNILRHANATEINLHLNRHNGHISLMVEDDGVGFDPEKTTDGMGTRNIRSRVAEINGDIFFDSLPGRGCTVTVEMPIPAKS